MSICHTLVHYSIRYMQNTGFYDPNKAIKIIIIIIYVRRYTVNATALDSFIKLGILMSQ